MNIKPIIYRFKDYDSKIHFGIGAQTFEKTLKELNIDNSIVYYNKDRDEYTVDYTELQMLTIPVVQDHEYRIRTLEEENEKLRKQIQLLTNGEA